MTENEVQDQVTEQAGQNGTAEEADVNRGPFEQQAEAEAAAKAAGSKYKTWTVQAPGKPARFTVAIDSQRAILAAAKADGYAASRVGGKKAMVTAADFDAWFAGLTDEQKAEWFAAHAPKGKGGKGKKADQQ